MIWVNHPVQNLYLDFLAGNELIGSLLIPHLNQGAILITKQLK
ncbi:hypothetical protein SAMN05444394_2306 [Algoriphagus halophilus]|uniref:Uncharacterized protein n=1 Tax=Algoriphagus halophilus TaxID=226505 RepID=A0A1N6EMD7_9BACT|nr:hypothetical protein SAMN05444394_2306 [Algoriphagus halophilus]